VRNDIRYIQCYDYDINIGRGYNRNIECLPDDCWVCINDSDAMYLNPKFGEQLNDIINKHGKEYSLLGCMTNRLRGVHQLHNGEFSNDFDVKNHFDITIDLARKHYDEVEETTGVAGVMMLFKKSTWKQVGGFKEGIITADSEFNKAIKKIGCKVGLMKGVYIFHSYRVWETDRLRAANSTQHLIK
jgi:GT2 family glycosyltransferase